MFCIIYTTSPGRSGRNFCLPSTIPGYPREPREGHFPAWLPFMPLPTHCYIPLYLLTNLPAAIGFPWTPPTCLQRMEGQKEEGDLHTVYAMLEGGWDSLCAPPAGRVSFSACYHTCLPALPALCQFMPTHRRTDTYLQLSAHHDIPSPSVVGKKVCVPARPCLITTRGGLQGKSLHHSSLVCYLCLIP